MLDVWAKNSRRDPRVRQAPHYCAGDQLDPFTEGMVSAEAYRL